MPPGSDNSCEAREWKDEDVANVNPIAIAPDILMAMPDSPRLVIDSHPTSARMRVAIPRHPISLKARFSLVSDGILGSEAATSWHP